MELGDTYERIVAARRLVIGLDFDGTLAPIVADPTQARIHPPSWELLDRLGNHAAAVAVITGRPAVQALDLGELDALAMRLAPGRRLVVLGQYGQERWDSTTHRLSQPEPSVHIERLRRELPAVLAAAGEPNAWVEDKGLALAVHTRRLAEPQGAFDRLLVAIEPVATKLGLKLEPGKHVIEIRSAGIDKGQALAALLAECDADGVLFAGDDLGDLPAFAEVRRQREAGLAGLSVFAGSAESPAIAEAADMRVEGPEGLAEFLDRLLDCLES